MNSHPFIMMIYLLCSICGGGRSLVVLIVNCAVNWPLSCFCLSLQLPLQALLFDYELNDCKCVGDCTAYANGQ